MFNPQNLRVGDRISCLYPKGGSSNVLASRDGVVDRIGNGFVTVKLSNGLFRTFKFSKMVSAKLGSGATVRG